MEMIEIAVDQLRAHPHNSNVMPEPLLAKLAAHIERTDRYPPVIVRPVGQDEDGRPYEIIDGHHRVQTLRRLGRAAVRCVVWAVDDDEALMLMATLNRLEGQDDPRKRAKLVAELTQHGGMKGLTARLPERAEQLKKLLELAKPAPGLRPPEAKRAMVEAVHFFLKADDRRALEQRLKAIGGDREAALMALVCGRDGCDGPDAT
ncbi:MAG: ParB/RepB/Spo0J family partition protein [Phycisphaeraceae bacterium]